MFSLDPCNDLVFLFRNALLLVERAIIVPNAPQAENSAYLETVAEELAATIRDVKRIFSPL